MVQSRWAGSGLACAMACSGPALDVPGREPVVSVTLEPAADAAEAPPTFRARVSGAAAGEPWLLRGALSSHHERALRRGELSATLRERAVPLRYWRESSTCVVQPLVWLEPGTEYTLGFTGMGRAQSLHVAAESAPRAARIFPPAGVQSHGAAVYCGPFFDDPPSVSLLEPGAVAAAVTRQAGAIGSASCVLITAAVPESPLMAPPMLGGTLLEPTQFAPAPSPSHPAGRDCPGALVAGACVETEDDRVFVTPLEQASYWLLSEPHALQRSLRVGERARLLDGLEPGARYELRGQVLGADGQMSELHATLHTTSERRHLVLNEVLADALGPEPASEWVELVNDSARPAPLGDVWLEDGAGAARLPDTVLAPGEHVLLVDAEYRRSGLDVSAPQATRLLELSPLGTRGLANGGESLLLVGPEGTLSRFPPLAASRAGRSWARRELAVVDDDPAAFAEHGAPGASPGTPNTFD